MALQLARHFRTEIVSADSRQFFREMNIGTAKPSPSELAEIKHHLVNSLSIHDEYNAGRFETDALECIIKIFSKSDYAILCGGSGLYVDIVCRGSDTLPASNPDIRSNLNTLFREQGLEALQTKLRQLDPEFFHQVDLNNPHRLIRAIEVCLLTGSKYSALRTAKRNTRPFDIMKIGLEDERPEVYARIDRRVDSMMHHHLLDEAKMLYEYRHLNALQAVGYTELFSFIEGKISLDEAIAQIRQHTRNYAKRQWTWFRKDKEIKWFRPGNAAGVIAHIESLTKQSGH